LGNKNGSLEFFRQSLNPAGKIHRITNDAVFNPRVRADFSGDNVARMNTNADVQEESMLLGETGVQLGKSLDES
jgi:hypothetical protein